MAADRDHRIEHPRRALRATITVAIVALAVAGAGPVGTAGAQASEPEPYAYDLEYQVLSTDTQDPTAIQVADDGRVVWVEREGAVRILKPDGTQVEAGRLPVAANDCDDCVSRKNEEPFLAGAMGLLLSKDFTKSGKLYVYWSVAGSRDKRGFGVYRLSTFVVRSNNKLDMSSEEILLEVPMDMRNSDHYAGNLDWLPDGTILLTTGDNIPAALGPYGPRDLRSRGGNGELSVQNPADRRGKILRLMPDGSVPDGSQRGVKANPFFGESGRNPYIPDIYGKRGDGKIPYDPYIYSLGFKQPFRGSVHPDTGVFYVGDVGPDATQDDPNRGPAGREEINVVPFGGGTNHGWPRCIADNKPYMDYNYETGESKGPLDCSKMTGSVIHYQKQDPEDWPVVGAGLNTSVPAVVYPTKPKGALALPDRFAGKLMFGDYHRGFLYAVPTTRKGLDTDWRSWEVIVPPVHPAVFATPPEGYSSLPTSWTSTSGPIDMTTGPDGALYILEYGPTYFNNSSSRVVRFTCSGCTSKAADYGLEPGANIDFGVEKTAPTAAPVTAAGIGKAPPVVLLVLVGLVVLVALSRGRRIA